MRTMSNYFVKGAGKAGDSVKLLIEADNVFTTCPDCGKETTADLGWLMKHDPDFSFHDTRVCCSECSKKRQQEKRHLHLV